MSLRLILILALLSGCGVAFAQDDDLPNADDLAQATAKRFPQPVRVGDLLERRVLEPVESMPTLGRVRSVVKEPDGTIAVVMDYYVGFLGLHTRRIAVPVNGMVLLGQFMEVMDFEPGQLNKFPAFDPAGTRPLAPDTVIRVGLAKPAH
jgi:hypothetical protein